MTWELKSVYRERERKLGRETPQFSFVSERAAGTAQPVERFLWLSMALWALFYVFYDSAIESQVAFSPSLCVCWTNSWKKKVKWTNTSQSIGWRHKHEQKDRTGKAGPFIFPTISSQINNFRSTNQEKTLCISLPSDVTRLSLSLYPQIEQNKKKIKAPKQWQLGFSLFSEPIRLSPSHSVSYWPAQLAIGALPGYLFQLDRLNCGRP